MSHLNVTNFGPIISFSGDIKGFNIFIGPQASGKSTITKLLYFFKMIPFWAGNFELHQGHAIHYGEFIKLIRHRFINLFGPVIHHKNMKIGYSFNNKSNECFIEVFNKNGLVRFDFSKEIKDELEALFTIMTNEKQKILDDAQTFAGLVRMKSERLSLPPRYFIDKAKKLFCTDQTPIFIPAGRTLLTLLSGQVAKIPYDERDFIMGDFLETIQNIRPQFQTSLEDLAEKAQATRTIRPDDERAALAREMIYSILRGRYLVTNGEERIYHSANEYTKLSYASSGQQESVWILLVTYMLILERENVFIIFEEPEAHLYPEGQDAIIRLLSLLFGATQDNQIVVTTHSPYVLSSVNNLAYAGKIGKKNKDEISKIINRKFWIDNNTLSAYSIKGNCYDIIDNETNMIKSEEIDSASRLLNAEFDRILDHAF